jgi:hypothetical protein
MNGQPFNRRHRVQTSTARANPQASASDHPFPDYIKYASQKIVPSALHWF